MFLKMVEYLVASSKCTQAFSTRNKYVQVLKISHLTHMKGRVSVDKMKTHKSRRGRKTQIGMCCREKILAFLTNEGMDFQMTEAQYFFSSSLFIVTTCYKEEYSSIPLQ